MMRRPLCFFYWIFCLSVAPQAWCQTDSLRVDLESNKLEYLDGLSDDGFFVATGKTGAYNMHFFVINRSNQHVSTYNISREIMQLVGYNCSSVEIKIYLKTKLPQGKPRLEVLTYTKGLDQFYLKILENKPGDVASFACKGMFYNISLNKKDDELEVTTLDMFEQEKTAAFKIDDKHTKKLFKDKAFEFVPEGSETSPERGQRQNKVYVRGEDVFLISDQWENDPESILIMKLNVARGEHTIKSLPVAGDKVVHNSFLKNDSLFVVAASKTDLALSVYTLETQKQLAMFRYDRGQRITFKNSVMLKNGEDYEVEWIDDRTQRAMNTRIQSEIYKHNPFIVVAGQGKYTRLLVGSWFVAQNVQGGSVYVSSTGHFVGTSNPNPPVPPGSEFSRLGGTTSDVTYFYGYLNNHDLSPAPGLKLPDHGPVDRLQKRLKSIDKKTKLGGYVTISSQNNVCLFYVDKKKKQLVLMEF